MAHPDRPPSDTRLMVGARALVLVVCCAGPILIGAASFGVIGGWLVSPWLRYRSSRPACRLRLGCVGTRAPPPVGVLPNHFARRWRPAGAPCRRQKSHD
jgi:hypothetical protein